MTDDLTSLETTERRIITCEQEIQSYLSEIGDHGWDELGYLAVALRNLADSVRDALKTTRVQMANLMPSRVVSVPGVGEFTRRKDERVEWDIDKALKHLVAQVGDEFYGQPPSVYAEEVAAAIAQVFKLSYARKTALTARGLDPEDFCASTLNGYDVQLPAKSRGDFGEAA